MTATHAEDVRLLLGRMAFLELVPPVLARALEPFPVVVRTLDALHLATIEYLRGIGQRPTLATYDQRLSQAASAMGVEPAAI